MTQRPRAVQNIDEQGFQDCKDKKATSKFKVSVSKYIPKSSWLYSFATDFKFCYVRYLNRQEGFFTKFVKLN